jgi:hypothetical protein
MRTFNQGETMSNPADQQIASLIETLAAEAARFTCKAEDRQTKIDQISQLRASMEPTIIQHVKTS